MPVVCFITAQNVPVPLLQKRTTTRYELFAVKRIALRTDAGYITEAQFVVIPTTYWHNRRKTFNFILVQTLNGWAPSRKERY